MDVHAPTSGSVEGLATALTHARRTGVDELPRRWPHPPARAHRRRWGTTPRTASPNSCCRPATHRSCATPNTGTSNIPAPHRPEPQTDRYPGHCNTPAPSTAQQSSNASPGTAPRAPKNYCSQDNFGTHDRRLQSIYPFLMGLHSPGDGRLPVRTAAARLYAAAASQGPTGMPGRARNSDVFPQAESVPTDVVGLPARRTRLARRRYFACCCNSSVTVYLTDAQLKMAQWELIPGSWEHTLYFEAARSLHRTTLQSAQIQIRCRAGLPLTTGPRRTPMIKIAIALAAATVNIQSPAESRPQRATRGSHRHSPAPTRRRPGPRTNTQCPGAAGITFQLGGLNGMFGPPSRRCPATKTLWKSGAQDRGHRLNSSWRLRWAQRAAAPTTAAGGETSRQSKGPASQSPKVR